METVFADVLVVGLGPSGLTAVNCLAQLGVSAIGVSKYSGPAHTPRAHVTNQRTMEVFRDLGLEERVKEVGWPLSYLSNNVFATSMAGVELGRYRSYGTRIDRLSDYAAASPAPAMNIPQHVMEPVLLAAARETGADVRYYHELVHIEQTEDEVTSRIRKRDTGEEYLVRSRYVIGADGANSRVAQQLGFEFAGEAGLRGMLNAWIEADLTEFTSYRPAVIYSLSEPDATRGVHVATLISVRPWTEWSLLGGWDSPEPPTEAEILAVARRAIGRDDVPVRVKSITTWQVNNIVATEYRKGRVFLAGDAAHRHPPAGGLGTNTSVQDSYNLAWKIAMVTAGKAGEGLLQSYHDERRAVGEQVVRRAITSWKASVAMAKGLGLQEGQSLEEGWAVIRELCEGSPEGAERRARLRAAMKLQDYRSNAIGVDLGQKYVSNAVINEVPAFLEPERDPDLFYQPTTRPGAFLPHAWIERDRERVSTLDIVGKGRFALVTGVAGAAWEEAAAEVSAELDIDIDIRRIGLRCVNDDVVGEWEAVREVGDGGAILVRPDRYVAWRAVDLAADAKAQLLSVFRRILALDPIDGATQRAAVQDGASPSRDREHVAEPQLTR